MAESLASLFMSGTETYVLQRMSELEKKMDVVNADYLQLSWRLAESYDENAKLSARIDELERKVNEVDAEYLLTETLDENAKLSTRIADLEAKIDVVDTEYVQLNNDRWVSAKDTKTLELTTKGNQHKIRQNMLCKLINLEKLTIHGSVPTIDIEHISNKNVTHINIKNGCIPNLENFPSCCMLTFENYAPPSNVVISTLSAQKNNIKTISFSNPPAASDLILLANYCKSVGISIVAFGSW
jgi:tetrahydromethanopterin S-methyltransferase subunit G